MVRTGWEIQGEQFLLSEVGRLIAKEGEGLTRRGIQQRINRGKVPDTDIERLTTHGYNNVTYFNSVKYNEGKR